MKTMKELVESYLVEKKTAKISVISKNIEKRTNVFKNYESKATDRDKDHMNILQHIKTKIDLMKKDTGDEITWPVLKALALRFKGFKQTGLKIGDFEYLMRY